MVLSGLEEICVKGFEREEPLFSLCGLKCGLCPMNVSGYCPGCGGGEGNQSCAIARCSLDHECVQFCWDCPEYPCPSYEGFEEYDSFIPHRGRGDGIERARKLGLDAYLAQLREKRSMLDELLQNYNNGRLKTFFCTAACLLTKEELRLALDKLRSAGKSLTLKERASLAERLLRDAAQARGVSLKLVKKPKGV